MGDTAFGSYVLGLAGLSLVRRWYDDDAAEHRDRLIELATTFDTDDLLGFSFPTPEMEPKAGYTLWSHTYDGDNPMIAAEQAVVTPRLGALFTPGARALDAGCGTGRHAEELARLGYQVIGTDLTPAMLDIARDKVPTADFREGTFEALPVDDDAVDLIVSALAVCHAVDLDVVFREFARVLAPGGRIVISDPHPTAGQLGGQAFFPGHGFALPFVRNRAHPISTYVSAMVGAGFQIEALTELPFDETVLETNPANQSYPEATIGGLAGLPFVLIWEATLA